MLLKMKGILVVGPRKEFHNIVDVLYHTGTLHLEDVTDRLSPRTIGLKRWKTEYGDDITALLVKIGGVIRTLPATRVDREQEHEIYETLYWMEHGALVDRVNEVFRKLETTTRDLAARKSDLQFRVAALERYEKTIRKIQPLEEQLPFLEGFEVTVLLIQKEFEDVIGLIGEELEQITDDQFELISAEIDEETIATITVFSKRHADAFHAFIYSKNVNEVRLPPEYMGRPFNEVLELIDEQTRQANAERDSVNEQLASLSEEWYLELSVLEKILIDKKKEIDAFGHFGYTDHTCMVMGWVPEKYLAATSDALARTFGNRVVVTELSLSRDDYNLAPTLYENPRIVKPFEFLMQLVRPPKYLEVDPSPFLAIFFPLFFGLMVGDIGYGLVILGFGLIMRRRFSDLEWLRSLMNIMIICSIPTIFFGFLYGEFFGDLGEVMGWIHPVHVMGISLNRMEAMLPMLILAVAIGVLHVFLGLGLGIMNAIAVQNRKHVAEKAGMISAISGLILILGAATGALPPVLLPAGIVALIVGVPLIIYGGGPMGLIEIMGTVGNILSYARLMAIGMASVILAMVANTLGGALGIVLIGVTMAILLHTLNIVLAMFSPSLHSIRLHVVECFSKFYEGGGTFYTPFKRQERTN
ncbi:MAG: V-type ATP synthase subunit I [Methanomicrobiaceae archaeon]|nr:V-type ATP synthase subunit I [Methanomicrobiaceae archaeon]